MRKLLYLLILLVLPAGVCFGWSSGHAIITPPAVNVLPQWEKDIWSSISPVNYSYNPDNFLSSGSCAERWSIAPYLYA